MFGSPEAEHERNTLINHVISFFIQLSIQPFMGQQCNVDPSHLRMEFKSNAAYQIPVFFFWLLPF